MKEKIKEIIKVYLIENQEIKVNCLKEFFGYYNEIKSAKYSVEVVHIEGTKKSQEGYDYEEDIFEKNGEFEKALKDGSKKVFMVDLALTEEEEKNIDNEIYNFEMARRILNKLVKDFKNYIIIESQLDENEIEDYLKYEINDYFGSKDYKIVKSGVFEKKKYQIGIKEMDYFFGQMFK